MKRQKASKVKAFEAKRLTPVEMRRAQAGSGGGGVLPPSGFNLPFNPRAGDNDDDWALPKLRL